jgi:phosphoribosyl 1,2-cyclic phosphodiesterase
MRYASLASSSSGNCHAISDGEKVLLIDAGISFKQIRVRLEGLGWSLGQVRGVAVTHEHDDHIKALPMILKHTDWEILATPDTMGAIEARKAWEAPSSRWTQIEAGRAVHWNGWDVHPFSVPHDGKDTVAFRIEAGGKKMAVVTDLGYVTKLAMDYCKDLDFLAIESNHDVDMLREGTYDPWLKNRILGKQGHLSNDACAALLAKIISPDLKNVVLAHLSENNNDPALAKLASITVIDQTGMGAALYVASPNEPFEIIL